MQTDAPLQLLNASLMARRRIIWYSSQAAWAGRILLNLPDISGKKVRREDQNLPS